MTSAHTQELMSDTTVPSEMSLETNVLRYLANCLEREARLAEGSITMASPTQNEEAILGYDSRVKLPDGLYVQLQFKRPIPNSVRVCFRIPSDQVAVLLKLGAGSSFFVLPVVRTNEDMWDAKTSLLDHTLMVDACDFRTPFATSAPDTLYRPLKPRTFVRTACVDTGDTRAVTVWQGHGRNRMPLPAKPVSCLCDPHDIGFVVKDGIARPRPGKDRDRERFEATVGWHSDEDRLRVGTGTGGRHLIRVGNA